MKIKEISERTQLTAGNIRFYEKKGLLHPGRKENGYRDYTEEDLERLKQIQNLRMMGFAVEQVRDCLDERTEFQSALTVRIGQIEEGQKELACQLELCRMLLEEKCSVRELNLYMEQSIAQYEEKYIRVMQDIRRKDLIYYRARLWISCIGIFMLLILLAVCVGDWIGIYINTANAPWVGILLILGFLFLMGKALFLQLF